MKRALPWILTLLAAGGLAAGIAALARRPSTPAPVQGPAESQLFQSAPAGQGWLLTLKAAPDRPLRTVRFLPPLPGGWEVVQVLTQTGDQLVGRFQDGGYKDTLRVDAGGAVPPAFLQFARLDDAARLDNGECLLLYGDGTGSGAASWLLDLDPFSGKVQWAMKAAGSRLALEPGGQSCVVWGPRDLARATWAGKPRMEALPLPEGVAACDAVAPADGGRLLLAHPGGLAVAGRSGAWTMVPLPDPGPLAFPGVPGSLAVRPDALYWQARPGQLQRAPGGSAGEGFGPAALPADLPPDRSRDLQLLHLAGADPQGRLWFTLANPDLTIHPSAASPVLAAASALEGAPPDASGPVPQEPGPWLDYLKGGLDRVYLWDPARGGLQLVDWKAAWARLGVPPAFPLPLPRDLRPGSGALLLVKDTQAWWLPLDRLAP